MSAWSAALAVVALGAMVGQIATQRDRMRVRYRANLRSRRSDEAFAPVARLLQRFGLDPESARESARLATVVGLLVLVGVGGPLLALGLGAGALVARRQVARHAQRLATRRVVQALPSALDDLARSLRAGASLPLALQQVASTTRGPLATDWRRIHRSLHFGRRLGEAADDWARQRPVAEVRLATSAWQLGIEAGASMATSLEGIAATLRARAEGAAELRALSAQARLSALIIGIAPVGFCLLASRADPRLAHTLFATPLGWALLSVGAGLDLIGALWMRHLAQAV